MMQDHAAHFPGQVSFLTRVLVWVARRWSRIERRNIKSRNMTRILRSSTNPHRTELPRAAFARIGGLL